MRRLGKFLLPNHFIDILHHGPHLRLAFKA
jgi:hypothetical protein